MRAAAIRRAAVTAGLLWPIGLSPADAQPRPCEPPRSVRDATPEEARAFLTSMGKTVVTFVGYSGAEYQNRVGMLALADAMLAVLDPAAALINVGATAAGIGAVYERAKARGFTTTGVVSSQAKDTNATLSPCVDHVLFVPDASWGGRLADGRLSPTSTAIVAASTRLVAIGGGAVARDELLAAREAGKPVVFFAADMDHAAARARAEQLGEPPPGDFRGEAATVFGLTSR